MSVSLTIEGFRPPDEKWEKMRAAREACLSAGIPVPREIAAFFNFKAPDLMGVLIELQYPQHPALRPCPDGFEIDLSKLPEDLTVLRVYLSC